jgi:uncharacterized protein YjiS (DUF1127 family)
MPPQQTSFTSETGRDAAGLRFELAIPLMRDAPGNASGEVCPDPAIAAPRDASSEKQAAGPPVASTRSILSVLRGYWRAFRERRQVQNLRDLSDRELADIGLTPGDIDHLVARRAFERLRDGTAYLWPSRGA